MIPKGGLSNFSSQTIRQAALWLAANTAATGGATLGIESSGRFTIPNRGWAIGMPINTCAWAGIYPEFNADTAERILRAAIAETVSCRWIGVWLGDGGYHVDPVWITHTSDGRRDTAIAYAKAWGQRAIFDLATKETYYL